MQEEENIKILEEKNMHLWFHGSPLVLCSMRLMLDTENGKIFAAAKFMNVQPEHIKSLTVDVICYNIIHNVIDTIYDYTYMGFDVARNEDFGLTNKIPVPDADTRNIEFVLKSVTTINDETWYNENNSKFDTDLQQKDIFSSQGDYNKQFQELCSNSNIDASQLTFQPVFDEFHWMCSCGCLNWNDEQECSRCGISFEWLKKNISKETLERQERINRLAEEKVRAETELRLNEEKERQQAEFQSRHQQYQKQVKQQKNRRTVKVIVTVVLIVLLAVTAILCITNYLIPYVSYATAKDSLSKGLYDSAISQFSDIGNYLDSRELLLQAKYEKANTLYSSGKKTEAAAIYKTIPDYSDSKQKYYEIEYEAANEFYSEKDYINAAEIYSLIPEYLDSRKRLDSAYKNLYNSAVELLDKNNTDDAYEIFSYLGDYSDSEEMAKECIYKQAEKMYGNMEYKDVLDTYNQIKDYKDVPEILKELQYLSDIISVATDIEAPAVWSCEDSRCYMCNNNTSASYSLAFGIDGTYTFEMLCEGHSAEIEETGHYKIVNDKIYIEEHQNGKAVWKELMTIISIEKLENQDDGKNAVLTVTSPFDSKQTLVLYGNIISSNNIEF